MDPYSGTKLCKFFEKDPCGIKVRPPHTDKQSQFRTLAIINNADCGVAHTHVLTPVSLLRRAATTTVVVAAATMKALAPVHSLAANSSTVS